MSSPEGFISPPKPLPWPLRWLLGQVEKRLGRPLLANRIMAWYPKALIGAGVMEALVAHDEPEVPHRLLALIRLLVSFRVSCAFCIDLNGQDYRSLGISDTEVRALQDRQLWPLSPSLSPAEKAALAYVEGACQSPVHYPPEVVVQLKQHFNERGFVIIATTAAQVNFWARLIQGLGTAPAGFSTACAVFQLERYQNLVKTGRWSDQSEAN